MWLHDKTIRNTRPGPKLQKLSDGDGLYLFVQPSGAKWWRFRYVFNDREKMLSVGVYPRITLAEARSRREELRKQIAKGIDPSAERKAQKRSRATTFEAIAREWWEKRRHTWSEEYAKVVITRFEQGVFPLIGSNPINALVAADFLDCLQRLEKRGVIETAHKVQGKCSEVMRYAVATRRADRDPVIDLKGALTPVKRKHYASITYPSEVGALLRTIDGYKGKSTIVHCALRLLPLVFVRSSELRYARWEEFDLDHAQWKIPAERMKMDIPHIVPLSKQSLAILRELHPYTGPTGYLFPSIRSFSRPISENTINAALRRMGYTKDEMTGHGFRSMASTLLNEQGWNADAIERQLAHCEENEVRAAYNYAQHLPERRKMMQAWADYLEGLRDGKKADAEADVSDRAHDPKESKERGGRRRDRQSRVRRRVARQFEREARE